MNINLSEEIGGFFELETYNGKELYNNAIRLNNARNCLRYVIRTFDIKEIHVPFYTCSAVWQAIQKESCKMKFYRIDKNFLPVQEFRENVYILYTNYFGVNGKNVDYMASKYRNLIVDNAQSFYMSKKGIASFNSARKFFGVPDGAYLLTDKKNNVDFEQDNQSYERFIHLIKRVDLTANEAYLQFCEDEDKLSKVPIKYMSNLTRKILSGIDYKNVKEKRLANFKYLHEKLKNENALNINIHSDDVPMVYPYLCHNENLRKKLIENKIYTAQYWDKKDKDSVETFLTENIIPLPIDQRYSTEDMDRILAVIKK